MGNTGSGLRYVIAVFADHTYLLLLILCDDSTGCGEMGHF